MFQKDYLEGGRMKKIRCLADFEKLDPEEKRKALKADPVLAERVKKAYSWIGTIKEFEAEEAELLKAP